MQKDKKTSYIIIYLIIKHFIDHAIRIESLSARYKWEQN